jgi:hypothetical protein
MAMNQTDAEADDRRVAERVELEGQYTMRLDPRDGRAPIECPVLDFSITGVRLEVPGNPALPADVHILIGNLAHKARIVWRKDAVVGVDFLEAHQHIY